MLKRAVIHPCVFLFMCFTTSLDEIKTTITYMLLKTFINTLASTMFPILLGKHGCLLLGWYYRWLGVRDSLTKDT